MSSKTEKGYLSAQWRILAENVETGEIVSDETSPNIIVRGGRINILKQTFNLGGSPVTTGYLYLGVGSGSAAAAVTDTALGTELTANTPDRLTVTDTSGGALTDADITQETSGSFDQKIVVQGIYETTDGNNGSTFAEYGLFDQSGIGGNMFNRFVPATAIAKNSSIRVTCQVTIRV